MGKRERTHFPRPGAGRVRTHNLSTSRKTRKPQQIKRPIDGPPQLQHRGREVWKVRAAAAAVGNGDQTRAFRSSFSLSAVCTRLLFNTSAGLVHTNTHLLCTSAHTHAHAHPQLRPVVVVTLSGDVGVESDFGETTQRASTILITLLFAAAVALLPQLISPFFSPLFPFLSSARFLLALLPSSSSSRFTVESSPMG